MQKIRSLIDLVQASASSQAQHVFRTRSGDMALGRAALLDGASRLAARLQQQFEPRATGLLLLPAGLQFIQAFFGVILADMVAVPTPFPKPNRPVAAWCRFAADCSARFVLCQGADMDDLRALFADTPLASLPWIRVEDAAHCEAGDWVPPRPSGAQTVFLQYTSGSTSTPRGIALSHDNLLSNLEAIRRNFRHDESSRGVIWLPPYHDMGLIGGILEPLYAGFSVLLLPSFEFLLQPIRWLQAISEFAATTSGGPNFAYEYCCDRIAEDQKAGLDLSCWRVAFVGGEPVQASTLRRFEKAFRPAGFSAAAWHPCYGLAEATLLVSGKDPATAASVECSFDRAALERGEARSLAGEDPAARTLVSCGRPAHDTRVTIVAPHSGQPCMDGYVGEVEIEGPGVSATAAQEATSRVRSGDLGFLWQGELFLCGRLKEMLILKGRNLFPQDIELEIQCSHDALEIQGGAALSVEDSRKGAGLVIVQEVRRSFRMADQQDILRAIRRTLALHFDLQAADIVLVRPRAIPRTTSGKVRRRHALEQYLANAFEPHRIEAKACP